MKRTDIPDFAQGYDPYNSIDRFPMGRGERVIGINSAEEVYMFCGPSDSEGGAAAKFFGGLSQTVTGGE